MSGADASHPSSDDARPPLDQSASPSGPVSFAPTPLPRPRRGVHPIAVAVAIAAVVAVALVKPWGGDSPPDPKAMPIAAQAGAANSPGSGASPASSGGPYSIGDTFANKLSLAGQANIEQPAPSPETMAEIVHRLVAHAGDWGIGVGGEGPRLIRDDPWTDWVPVDPVAAGPIPGGLLHWPGTPLCTNVPQLFDRPLILAVTVPPGLAPDWRLLAWWTDGARVEDLAPSIHQVSPPGNRQISYLEMSDDSPWPDGRYEFHVVTGDHVLAMDVCLTRGG